MRVLHTADFHAGKSLRGFDRTPEIWDALQEIAGLARSERVDAVLVAGDLFDSVNPSADAEAAIFNFFLKLQESKVPSIIIAGNHDSAARLHSLAGLLSWVGVQAVAQPTADPRQMTRRLVTGSGETLIVGALPYLPERRLVKAADVLGADVGAWRQKYREGMNFFLRTLGQSFEAGAVNMLMLHATFEGAVASSPDKTSNNGMKFDLEHHYTVSPLQLPPQAQYIALGHVHKPQQVGEAPVATYPGSIVQLDFGEAGEKKQVNLVEVEAGRPAKVHALPLVSGKELLTVHADLDTLDARMSDLKGFSGLIKVVVRAPVGSAITGVKDRVLGQLSNVLSVDLLPTKDDATPSSDPREGLNLLELYERYHAERRGELPPALREAFEQADEAARQALDSQSTESPATSGANPTAHALVESGESA